MSKKEVEKLRCRQNKLKVKLRELKRKTVELGREMLRTALPSTGTPVQETIDSYEEQIERLTNLLKKLPEAAARMDSDCKLDNDPTMEIVADSPLPIVSSSLSGTVHTSTSSFHSSSPSPEPPILSPRSMLDYRTTKSPSEVRNSPPVLSDATLSNGERFVAHWEELKIGPRSEINSEIRSSSVTSSSTITTTANLITEEIDIDDKPELLNLSLTNVTKNDLNIGSLVGSVVEKIDISENVREMIKLDVLDDPPSPGEMIIDTTSVLQEFADRSDPEDSSVRSLVIDTGATNDTTELSNQNTELQGSSNISSSCDVATAKDPSVIEPRNHSGTEKDIIMTEQFPTLSNWLARMNTKTPIISVPTPPVKKHPKKRITTDNQGSIYEQLSDHLIFRHPGQKNTTESAEPARTISRSENILRETNNIIVPQWRNEQHWQDPERPQQLSQNLTTGNINTGGQIPAAFCPPLPLHRLYPGNYPVRQLIKYIKIKYIYYSFIYVCSCRSQWILAGLIITASHQ